ncbi:MAG: hypothetical protein ACOYL3_21570 [Desulfuromonadaceae bacterium]
MKTFTKAIVILACTLMISGCVSAQKPTIDPTPMFGEGFRSLQFPVEDKYIGYEWNVKSGEPNITKSPGLLATREKRTLSHLSTSKADTLFLTLSMLYNFGPSTENKLEFDKSLSSSGLFRIQAVNLGDIAFKLGIPYVTEAIAVDNFLMNNSKIIGSKFSVADPESKLFKSEIGGGSGGRVGLSGNRLILAYKVEKVKVDTYASSVVAQKILTLANKSVTISDLGLTATIKLMKAPLSNEVIWACDEAGARTKEIKAAWVVTLKDKKERPIAFPASTDGRIDSAIEDCSSFQAVISSVKNSLTDALERITTEVVIKKSTLDDRLDPVEVTCEVSLKKETFELETFK